MVTENGKFISDFALKELELKLDSKKFLRVHKSYIVNMEKIVEISPSFNNTYDLMMEISDERVPVSRSYITRFRKALGINK